MDEVKGTTYALHVAAQVLASYSRHGLMHELWETCERLMDGSGPSRSEIAL